MVELILAPEQPYIEPCSSRFRQFQEFGRLFKHLFNGDLIPAKGEQEYTNAKRISTHF